MKFILVAVCFFLWSGMAFGKRKPKVTPRYLDSLLKRKDYAKFSKLTGLLDPELSKPSRGNVQSGNLSNPELAFGDTLLTRAQAKYMQQKVAPKFQRLSLNFQKFPVSKWRRYVPFVISNQYNVDQRNIIVRAINAFNRLMAGCVQWAQVGGGYSGDSVFFHPGKGCWSYIGKKGGGVQTLSLASGGCVRHGTVLHEMAHAMGMLHEHNRPDRDKYIRVLHQNIAPDFRDQFIKVGGEAWSWGPYDYYSIMHYSPNAATRQRGPTFDILDRRVNPRHVGFRNDFSSEDKKKLRQLYC